MRRSIPAALCRWVATGLTVLIAFAIVPAASAAPTPGTPVAVAPGVPDQDRAWELVTSPDPVSALLWSALAIAPDGSRLAYMTFGLLPDAPLPEPPLAPALARRGAAGWENSSLPVPSLDPDRLSETGPVAFSPDLESSIWATPLPNQGNKLDLFRSPQPGQYIPLLTGTTLEPLGGFVGSSTDTQSVVAESEEHLLAADATRTSGTSIYEHDGSSLRLVDVAEDGTLLSNCGSTGEGPRSVSADARRIYFSTSPGCGSLRRVFLRADATTTTEISASQCTLPDCGPEADVAFVGATPSGDVAFLVTSQRLTDDDGDDDADLYRYEVATGLLSLASPTVNGVDLVASAKEDVRVAADGSRAYFKATVETGPGETSERLYMADSVGLHLVCAGEPSAFYQVSPSGRYAVFDTTAPLLGSDADSRTDVYRYDAESGGLAQISLGPDSGNGPHTAQIKRTAFQFETGYSSGVTDYTAQLARDHPFRAMSDDGSRVFFITAERLLPADRNDVFDVYEWASGSLGLVSSGAVEAEGSDYVGSTPDGRTVLFGTGDTLVPRDRDGDGPDLYVARIGGGFPEPSPPAACDGDCTPPPREALRRPGAASSAVARSIRVAGIGRAERRRAAATGWLRLLVEVPRAGSLTAKASARLDGARRRVAATRVRVRRAGSLPVQMRLSKRARATLAARGLRLQVELRLTGLESARRFAVRLGGDS
jgi:hypothetical protein